VLLAETNKAVEYMQHVKSASTKTITF